MKQRQTKKIVYNENRNKFEKYLMKEAKEKSKVNTG